METILNIDNSILDFLVSIRTEFFNDFFAFFSYIGNGGIVWIIAGLILLFFRRTRKAGFILLLSIGITALINNFVLKILVDRARPFIENDALKIIISEPSGASFPSGHSSASFAAATILLKYNKKIGSIGLVTAVLIAFSRIYFCVHYPSDIVVGAVEGIIIALIVLFAFNRIYNKVRKNKLLKVNEKKSVAHGFTYEPIPDKIWNMMKGKSYPDDEAVRKNGCKISRGELFYLNVLYFGFDCEPNVGEIICNRLIAKDLCKIFKKLYDNRYMIEKIRLIDNYNADDERSMTDNNSSCFCYRNIAHTNELSLHSLGMAVDINPLYNPYIANGIVMPVAGEPYADRSRDFNHKIDEKDYCYKVFKSFGFHWGGSWEGSKDYQHFYRQG